MSMAVFGTVTIAATHDQKKMKNIGVKSANAISSMTMKLQRCFKREDGLSFVYGNAN